MSGKENAKGKEQIEIERGDTEEQESDAKKIHGIKPKWKIEKRRPGESEPYSVEEYEGNVFLDEGINEIWTAIVSPTTITPFDGPESGDNAEIGVGDGTASEDSTHTGLQGDSKEYVGLNSGYPEKGVDQKAVFRATFSGDEANFAWKEITVRNDNQGAGDKININRLQQDMGTKSSGTEWTAELTLKIE